MRLVFINYCRYLINDILITSYFFVGVQRLRRKWVNNSMIQSWFDGVYIMYICRKEDLFMFNSQSPSLLACRKMICLNFCTLARAQYDDARFR